ncbi:MAG: hypothetical protein RIS39_178, partial [Actinomycetota bacterium]
MPSVGIDVHDDDFKCVTHGFP